MLASPNTRRCFFAAALSTFLASFVAAACSSGGGNDAGGTDAGSATDSNVDSTADAGDADGYVDSAADAGKADSGVDSGLSSKFIPVNPNASADAKKLLAYLGGLQSKSDHHVIPGQQLGRVDGYMDNNMLWGYTNLVQQLQTDTGHLVGLIGASYGEATPDATPPYVGSDSLLTTFWDMGGLVAIVWLPPNPFTDNKTNQDQGDAGAGDLTDLVTPGTSAYAAWHASLDNMALDLLQLQSTGVVVLFRPFPEQNADWFWWGNHGGVPPQGTASPTPSQFSALWTDTFTYLTVTKGLNNLLWVFAGSARASTDALYYYPGNDYVDVVAADDYESAGPMVPDYPSMLALGKVMALAEFGPNPQTALTPTYDWSQLSSALTNTYPAFSYFMAWSGAHGSTNAADPNEYQALIDNVSTSGPMLSTPVIDDIYQNPW